jgi:hypothetical protein
MDDRARQFASAHWTALDAAMTRTMTHDEAEWCRQGVRWGLGAIAAKYAKRLIDAAGQDSGPAGIEAVGRELAMALDIAWGPTASSQR